MTRKGVGEGWVVSFERYDFAYNRPERWNRFFEILNMRLALQVSLKNINYCMGSHNGSIDTTHTQPPPPCNLQYLSRDSDTRILTSGFLHGSVSPKPLIILLGPFIIFRKFAEIFAAQGAPPVSFTPVVYLPPVSLLPVAIWHRRRWHQWQICHRYQQH